MMNPIPWNLALLAAACLGTGARADAPVFDVRARAPSANGKTLDTAALNKAVAACARPAAGRWSCRPGHT